MRACCVLSVVPGLSCINEAMAVTKECQREWDGKGVGRSLQEWTESHSEALEKLKVKDDNLT